MLALIATFVVPGRDEQNNFGGMSPFVSYYFNYVIVPGVQKVHGLVGNDPKAWAKLQLSMLPFLLIDWFFVPGLFTSVKERRLARERLKRGDDRDAKKSRARDRGAMNVPPPEAFACTIIPSSELSIEQLLSDVDEPMQSDERSSAPMEIELTMEDEVDTTTAECVEVSLTSIRKRADDAERRLHAARLAIRKQTADNTERRMLAKRTSNEAGGEVIRGTPPRVESTFSIDRKNFPPFPWTSPNIVDRLLSNSYSADIYLNRDQIDNTILTPDVRRRLE